MPDLRDEMILFLEKQGAHVRKTKKGLFIQTPKGTATTHLTYGDIRSRDNDIAQFRRIGLIHPEDKRMRNAPRKKRPRTPDGYPDYITGAMRPQTEKRFRQLLYEKGWPVEVTSKDLAEFGGNFMVNKALYHVGYRYHPDGKLRGKSQVWVAPDDIQELHLELITRPTPKPEDTPAVENPTIWFSERTTETTEKEEPVDSRSVVFEEGSIVVNAGESDKDRPVAANPREEWTVDMRELLGTILMDQVEAKLSVLNAAGIEYELRLWRK